MMFAVYWDVKHEPTTIFLNNVLEISPWTGRFYSLLDPSYAKNNIPIIASVSEHQPTTWSSFYFDLQLLVFMFPGMYRNTALVVIVIHPATSFHVSWYV